MRKPKVGEVLYFVPSSSREEKHNVTVTKVGQKFFEVDNEPRRKYRIEDWCQKDIRFYCLSEIWESKEIYEQYRFAIDCKKIVLPELISHLNIEQTIEVYNYVKQIIGE